MDILKVNGLEVKKISVKDNDYLCISDFANNEQTAKTIVQNWMRNKNTIEYLGLWEKLNNKDFNVIEFDAIKNEAGLNRFTLSPTKWISTTNAIGITSKAGRYNSGTYAHVDIAMEFASWLSPEFKLYLITEFQRLKKEEAVRNNELTEWDNYRWLSKINYKVHTDAIRDNIIPVSGLPKHLEYTVYASEADMLNKIVFGMTAVEFKIKYPEHKNKNMREMLATTAQLAVISNTETLNANMIREGLTQEQRFNKLTIEAYEQLKSFGALKMPPRIDAPLFTTQSDIKKPKKNNN